MATLVLAKHNYRRGIYLAYRSCIADRNDSEIQDVECDIYSLLALPTTTLQQSNSTKRWKSLKFFTSAKEPGFIWTLPVKYDFCDATQGSCHS